MQSFSILSPLCWTMRCAINVLQPPRFRKAPIASHFCSSLPRSNKWQMDSTPPHSRTISQLLGRCLQMLQMHPAASRLSSSSDEGAAIKGTSKGIPFKSRMRSRAAMLGRAATESGLAEPLQNFNRMASQKYAINISVPPKLQMVEHANRRFHSLFDLSKSRSSDKSCAESVHCALEV